jgi:hypothetical protein
LKVVESDCNQREVALPGLEPTWNTPGIKP